MFAACCRLCGRRPPIKALGAYHRRRLSRQYSARAAGRPRRRLDLAADPVPPVFRWLAADRRCRRKRDAAHLQLRDRHGRDRRSRFCGRRAEALRDAGRRAGQIGEVVVAATRAARHLPPAGWRCEPSAHGDLDFRSRLQHARLVEAARGADYPAEIALVLSNRPEAKASLTRRAPASRPPPSITRSTPAAKNSKNRCKSLLDLHRIELICLAGFMRLLTPGSSRLGRPAAQHPPCSAARLSRPAHP